MPAVPYNRTNVISNAMILMGKPRIESIDSGGPVAQDANQIYDMLLTNELSHPDWRFATTVIQLSQVAGVNPGYRSYTAAYQKPAGLLAIWNLWPKQPYEIFGERIWTYSGRQTIQVEYRELVPESKMPPTFINYFVWLLSYTLSIGVTEHKGIIATLESGMNRARAQAMNVNSQERPNIAIQSSPWIENRGTGYGGTWGGVG